MSHITYLPSGKNSNVWNKSMIEMLRRMPRPFYKETLTVKDKDTGKTKEVSVNKKLSDSDIRRLVKSKWISSGDNGKFTNTLPETDSDVISKKFDKNFEKIKKTDKNKEV